MDNKKTEILKTRISAQDKQAIANYCIKHNIDISKFIRATLLEKIQKEEN